MPYIELLGQTEHYDTPLTFNYMKAAEDIAAKGVCSSSGKYGGTYFNVFQTFDIETTSINKDPEEGESFGFMYIWMVCINRQVVMGRTWDEFLMFEYSLKEALQVRIPNARLVTYVHFLAFEFQFVRNFVEVNEIFATEKRKIIRALIDNFFEYRCSYRLSNMSLDKFIQNTPNAHYKKQSGEEFDYDKIRTPITVLSNKELGYCFCDVRGLYEAIEHLLEEDTLASIPMTSTGYLRREVRAEMKKNSKNYYLINHTKLSPPQYTLCKAALRGGNAHANPYWADEILGGITESFDEVKCRYPKLTFISKEEL